MKILIVEDDVKAGDALRQGLAEAGFVVDLARDDFHGLHRSLAGDDDLIAPDVMLPSLDGWGILQTRPRKGEVLPRSLIASQVWDMNFDGDTNLIDFAARSLRAKVDTPFEPKLIHSVRGMGSVLEAMEPN
jgi:two-component system copper resistance phosphate regulon response regulator CusR